MAATISHKRGDTFEWYLELPADEYEDGYFVGWTVASQIRNTKGRLVAELSTSWGTPAENTRVLRLFAADTAGWPLGDHEADVQFTRESDGFIKSTETFIVSVGKDVTITENG